MYTTAANKDNLFSLHKSWHTTKLFRMLKYNKILVALFILASIVIVFLMHRLHLSPTSSSELFNNIIVRPSIDPDTLQRLAGVGTNKTILIWNSANILRHGSFWFGIRDVRPASMRIHGLRRL